MRRNMSDEADNPIEEKKIPDEPIEVTDESIEGFIADNKVTVLDCFAEWCGPCRMLGPIFKNLAKTYQGKVVFGKLDVDKNPNTCVVYGISAMPTILIFKDDDMVSGIIGLVPEEQLKAEIDKYL